jgi:glycosyltransferase involved in cell wall biosynthesis
MTGATGGRRLLIVTDRSEASFTAHLRGDIFREPLERNGWEVVFIDLLCRPGIARVPSTWLAKRRIVALAANFDAVYLLKTAALDLIRALKAQGRAKVIFDFTDALWRPNFQPAWRDIDRILESVDAVFTENEVMLAYARGHNARVYDLPACTQTEKFAAARRGHRRRDGAGVTIGWVGSHSTGAALRKVRQALDNVGSRHPGLKLRALGAPSGSLPQFSHVEVSALPSYDEPTMISEILDFDIGIFPPPGDIGDYEARGTLKGVLYMSGGIPPVFQNAGGCRRFVVDGVNGMLANDEAEWEAKLEALVSSSELRERMGRAALETVQSRHSLASVFALTERALLEVIGQVS